MKPLPKNEVQKIQSKVSLRVNDYPKSDPYDLQLISQYKSGNEESFKKLIYNYLDIISSIYLFPFTEMKYRGVKQNEVIDPKLIKTFKQNDLDDLIQAILEQFLLLVIEHDNGYNLPFRALVKGKLRVRVYDRFCEPFINDYMARVSNSDTQNYIDKIAFVSEKKVMFDKRKYTKLYNALDELNDKQRNIIELSAINGWNSSEIADELNMKPTAVRKAKERTLSKLQKLLGGN